nr:adhesin biosynthesis transcription regulatory family protein [Escherichia coli]
MNGEHFSLLIEISPIRSKKKKTSWLLRSIWLMVIQSKKVVKGTMFPLVIFLPMPKKKKLNYTHSIVSALKYFYRE